MPNLIVRDVSEDDREALKKVAAQLGISLQAFLAEKLHMEASHFRRREAIARMRERVKGRSRVTASEVAESISAMREERDARLAGDL